MKVVVPWKPHAKQRPRFANGHAYTSAPTKKAEKAIREAFLEAVGPDFTKFEGNVAVRISLFNKHFEIEIEDTDDYVNRSLRGDLDNYAKTILDCLNEVAYADDKLITHLEMRKN